MNPPRGIKTVGFSAHEGVVESIETDLSATALVLADDETKVAILALDLCISRTGCTASEAPFRLVRGW